MRGYLAATDTKLKPRRGKHEFNLNTFYNHLENSQFHMCKWLFFFTSSAFEGLSPWQLLGVQSSSVQTGCCCQCFHPGHEAIRTPSCHFLRWPGIVHLGTTVAHTPPVNDQWACRCDGLPPSHHDGECVLILSHWGGGGETTLHLDRCIIIILSRVSEGEATVPGKNMFIPAKTTNSGCMARHAA